MEGRDSGLLETVDRYLRINAEAVRKLRISVPEDSYLFTLAKDFMQMIKSYSDDAAHFKEKNELIKAVSALNYAHGWIDAGARIGLFDVGGDHRLFTLYR